VGPTPRHGRRGRRRAEHRPWRRSRVPRRLDRRGARREAVC